MGDGWLMPNLSLLRIEEFDEAVVLLGVGDVGEGVVVEGFQEAIESFAEGRFEAADGDDGAGVGFEFEALDDFEVWLAGADDVAEADLGGGLGEGDAAGAAGGGGDEIVEGEGLDDADEVVLGDVKGSADFGGADGAVGEVVEVEEDAKGVVGVKGEVHLSFQGSGEEGVGANGTASHAGEEEALPKQVNDVGIAADEAAPAGEAGMGGGEDFGKGAVAVEKGGLIVDVGMGSGEGFEFGGEVEAAFVEGTVVEPNGALVAVAEGVAEDAVEGGEAGSGAGEEDGLVGVSGGVEAVAGGALEGYLGAGCGVGEPVAHGSAGDAADVEFEGLAGDGVAAGEAVFTEQGEVLAGAMVEGFAGGEVDLEDGFAEPVELRDDRGDSSSGAGGSEMEIGFGAAEAG